MIEYSPEAWKQILQPKHVVHFVGSHPEFWQQRVAGKYFRVMLTQQIPYTRAYILEPNGMFTADMKGTSYGTGQLGLYPDNDSTLFETLIGMKSTSGNVLLYPRFPVNQYWATLEASGFTPTAAAAPPTSNDWYRYLGCYSEELTPPDRPTLRIYTIADEEAIGLRLYNDVDVYQKVVLVGLVNRCLMKEEKKEALSEKELERCRELIHPGLTARGYWGETVP